MLKRLYYASATFEQVQSIVRIEHGNFMTGPGLLFPGARQCTPAFIRIDGTMGPGTQAQWANGPWDPGKMGRNWPWDPSTMGQMGPGAQAQWAQMDSEAQAKWANGSLAPRPNGPMGPGTQADKSTSHMLVVVQIM